jgi:hypothetical protein
VLFDAIIAVTLAVVGGIIFRGDSRVVLVVTGLIYFIIEVLFSDTQTIVHRIKDNDYLRRTLVPFGYVAQVHGMIYLPLLLLFGVVANVDHDQLVRVRPEAGDYAAISLYQSLIDFLLGICIKALWDILVNTISGGHRRYLKRLRAPIVPRYKKKSDNNLNGAAIVAAE